MIGTTQTFNPADDRPQAFDARSTEHRLFRLLRSSFGPRIEPIDVLTPLDRLALDSLDWIDLLSGIEDEFDVRLDDDCARDITCVGELARRIDLLRQA